MKTFNRSNPNPWRGARPAVVAVAVCALQLSGLGARPARGQSAPEEARIQIDHLEKLANKAAEVVDVTLDQTMLKLASKFAAMDEDDEDAAEVQALLKNLKGVYVKSFEFDHEGEYSEADVEEVRAQLRAPAWNRLVSVRSKHDGENDEVYFMGAEDNIQGLVILAAEPKELTVVNLVGPIDLDKLSKLEGHAGIPRMNLEAAPRTPKASTRTPKPKRAPQPKAEEGEL